MFPGVSIRATMMAQSGQLVLGLWGCCVCVCVFWKGTVSCGFALAQTPGRFQ